MGMPPFPVLTEIDDPIAEEVIPYSDGAGVQRVFKIKIGKPVKHWNAPAAEIWFCPVSLEHRERELKCIRGVGPATALANAGVWINAVFQKEVVDPG